MPLPKILLFGKVGQVGWELRRTLAPMSQLVAVDYPDVDFTAPDSIRRAIAEAAPNIVINAAAYTAVDKCESEFALAKQINADAPGVMAEEAQRRGALLVHYSTDYVFDGTKTSPYVEADAPNPLSAYGRSKLAGDEAIRRTGCNHLIFRLCWVYGARGANFMLTMQRLAREREKLRVVADQFGCPTWSRMIAETTAHALRSVRSAADARALSGAYHLAASGHTSWHGFASAIIDLMPLDARKCRAVEAITSAEYPTPTKRPAYSVLSCAKLEQAFGLRLPDWHESLRQVVES
ncbi:dTDP-4-dehydrorhamnose reductase [Opitutus terrae]|uniref:dTDP-4-dehydrorhamnose reductase n=1 Tax=Opitutus terrae (strain DSM 11246 / JCM 15787 / PB90-1) TaxID=452637 RepID=B1ZZT1_OPITP|nr:dTDP-4-dehydrorhamnose reductase [Opitutus terrae]ACB77267.1 dTDP-4-dehydrorhamnose reductase [Opitutus terrae PB90-1]